MIFKTLFCFFLIFFNTFTLGQTTLLESYSHLNGQTFHFPGPNCFGVAMFAKEANTTIRGVDLKEFSTFIKARCFEVETPVPGDLGTFHNGSDFIHAFILLEDDHVLEKTGVDYLGKTPIHIREFSHTLYTFEASPECRRYGGGSKDCYNKLAYFRCDKGLPPQPSEVLNLNEIIENLFEESLIRGKLSSKHIEEIRDYIHLYENEIKKVPHDQIPFFNGRLESYNKQLIFLINVTQKVPG